MGIGQRIGKVRIGMLGAAKIVPLSRVLGGRARHWLGRDDDGQQPRHATLFQQHHCRFGTRAAPKNGVKWPASYTAQLQAFADAVLCDTPFLSWWTMPSPGHRRLLRGGWIATP